MAAPPFQLGCLLIHYMNNEIQKDGCYHVKLKYHTDLDFHLNHHSNLDLLVSLMMDSLVVQSYLHNLHLNLDLPVARLVVDRLFVIHSHLFLIQCYILESLLLLSHHIVR